MPGRRLTSEYFGQTRDFGIITTAKPEVTEISNVFEADWNDKPVTPEVPSLVRSPVNSRSKLTSLINGAKNALDTYCEEAEDPWTLGAMVEAVKRGVKVRFIAAVLSGQGKVNGNAQGITYLQSGGVHAICKSFLYIHAKMVLADYGKPNAQAYVGSENFSCVSLDDNRECGIVVSESNIHARLQSTYDSDWAQPSVTVRQDKTALRACQGDPAGRAQARRKVRL
jgi:hypothetical protein